MIDYTAGIDVTYPYWKVEAYRCDRYSEAWYLAQDISFRTGRYIPIMEYLDAMTPPYELGKRL